MTGPRWTVFWAWMLAGALLCLGVLALLSIGVVLILAGLVAAGLVGTRWPEARNAVGIAAGAGLAALLVGAQVVFARLRRSGY